MDDSENPHGPFFQRFGWDDTAALAREIESVSADLARARKDDDEPGQLAAANTLGNLLTTARQEKAAADLEEWALALARRLGDKHEEAAALMNLATARQYLGQRDDAQTLFDEALDCGDPVLESAIQHHRGRCYAEQGRKDEARLCFQRALYLRTQAGEPRAAKSQAALDALDAMSEPVAMPVTNIRDRLTRTSETP
ncbi:MAG TPA: tetratricopeptide repeat protein [Rhizomicrobium sp.]|jgi:tetratricopeptide (TPR) repeat protein